MSVVVFGSMFRRRLLAHHRSDARVLPWRSLRQDYDTVEQESNRAYVVLVSEIMLQQTQASRVAELLPPFLERFPSVAVLAGAAPADVLRAWRGLGYNRRGLRLHELARMIVREYDGRIPRDARELERLPGIGRYTAGAIACFAFGQACPVVDTNVARVLSRVFFRCYSPAQRLPATTVERIAAWLVPTKGAADWHEALMDLGASVCTARSPECVSCPVGALCLSSGRLDRELFDPEARRKTEPTIDGTPRRLWRGRVLEWLRAQSEPRRVSEMIAEFGVVKDGEEIVRELRDLVVVLHDEGLVAVYGSEGDGGGSSAEAVVTLGRL